MDPWTWITTNLNLNAALNTLGLGVLAFLFARDLIITKGQHLRRVQDLIEHHAREIAAAKERLELVDESRKEWKAAAQAERERADAITATMGAVAESIDGFKYVLESLDTVVKEGKNA